MAAYSKRTKPRVVVQIAELERKNGTERLRLSVDEFTPADGEPSRYVSARVWYRARNGDWRPSKSGMTVRASELAAVIEALQHALSAMGEDEAA